MANHGTGSENTLSGIVGAAAVIVTYLREYWSSGRGSTFTAVVTAVREPLDEVRHGSTAYEILLSFAVIPILLVSIDATVQSHHWVLPLSADSITEPEIAVLAFTSSFVHAGPTHLWGNVVGYLLTMSALYPLAVLSGKKRQLAGFAVFNLLAIPLVTGQLSLLLPIGGATLGFSSVNAAFLGGLILFVFFAWETESGELNPIWSVGPAFASLALAFMVAPVVFPYMPPVGEYGPVFGLLGGLLAVCFFNWGGHSALRHVWLQKNPVLYWGVAVLLIGFARLLVFIPGKANLLAHFGGFYAGFFGLFAVVVGGERRTIRRRAEALGETMRSS